MPDPVLEQEFHEAMLDVDGFVKRETGYDAKLFRTLVHSMRGLAAAKKLLTGPRVQSGFEKLWELGRLDLSMEALVLKPEYASLFESDELAEARKRLQSADYDIRKCYE